MQRPVRSISTRSCRLDDRGCKWPRIAHRAGGPVASLTNLVVDNESTGESGVTDGLVRDSVSGSRLDYGPATGPGQQNHPPYANGPTTRVMSSPSCFSIGDDFFSGARLK